MKHAERHRRLARPSPSGEVSEAVSRCQGPHPARRGGSRHGSRSDRLRGLGSLRRSVRRRPAGRCHNHLRATARWQHREGRDERVRPWLRASLASDGIVAVLQGSAVAGRRQRGANRSGDFAPPLWEVDLDPRIVPPPHAQGRETHYLTILGIHAELRSRFVEDGRSCPRSDLAERNYQKAPIGQRDDHVLRSPAADDRVPDRLDDLAVLEHRRDRVARLLLAPDHEHGAYR